MGIEIIRQERTGEKRFAEEITYVIKELMKRGLDPTADRIFDFCATHPGDVKMISKLRSQGLENILRVYLILWGRTRDRIAATKPKEPISEASLE